MSCYQPTDKVISFWVQITTQSYIQRAGIVLVFGWLFVCELPFWRLTPKIKKISSARLWCSVSHHGRHAGCIKGGRALQQLLLISFNGSRSSTSLHISSCLSHLSGLYYRLRQLRRLRRSLGSDWLHSSRRCEFADWLLQHCSCRCTKNSNGQVTALSLIHIWRCRRRG